MFRKIKILKIGQQKSNVPIEGAQKIWDLLKTELSKKGSKKGFLNESGDGLSEIYELRAVKEKNGVWWIQLMNLLFNLLKSFEPLHWM